MPDTNICLYLMKHQPQQVRARFCGPLRAAHRERNKDALDKLIASHALSLGVTLVTNNVADFRGFRGLTIENWVDPAL
ncbi:MAG: hypothetical protein U1E86_26855 [Burkholderiaceae bacterium]